VALESLSDPLPAALVDQLESLAGEGPVIVDLSDITLITPRPIEGLVGWLLGSGDPDRCCLVCSRDTARALLSRWRVTRTLAVFGSVGDALQARRLGEAGYGSGWRADPLRTPRSGPVVHAP
jgi:hypothetical protein